MKRLEIIHLRLAGGTSRALVEMIRNAVEPGHAGARVEIFRHARLSTDLALHLHRTGDGPDDEPSELGLRLTSLLSGHGLVAHSVWVEAGDPGQPDGNQPG